MSEAESEYRKALPLLEPLPDFHNNLAFVLYDQERYEEALAHWERSVELATGDWAGQFDDADQLAGMGLALEALGRRAEALASYGRAVSLDANYLQCDVLQREALWSDAACDGARPLIMQLSPEEPVGIDAGSVTPPSP